MRKIVDKGSRKNSANGWCGIIKKIQIWLREKAERTNTQLPASSWAEDHGFAFSLFILQIGKLKLKLTVCATVGSIGPTYCSANFIVLWNSPVYLRRALMIHWGMRDAVLLSVTIWLAGMCFLWKMLWELFMEMPMYYLSVCFEMKRSPLTKIRWPEDDWARDLWVH